MRNSNGILLVYDITNYNSFEKVDFWLKAIRHCSTEKIVIYLFGNKLDLIQENPKHRKVDIDIVSKYVEENEIEYWVECSAKNDENLKDTFKNFYQGIYF